jgi:hypothetical protein
MEKLLLAILGQDGANVSLLEMHGGVEDHDPGEPE